MLEVSFRRSEFGSAKVRRTLSFVGEDGNGGQEGEEGSR